METDRQTRARQNLERAQRSYDEILKETHA